MRVFWCFCQFLRSLVDVRLKCILMLLSCYSLKFYSLDLLPNINQSILFPNHVVLWLVIQSLSWHCVLWNRISPTDLAARYYAIFVVLLYTRMLRMTFYLMVLFAHNAGLNFVIKYWFFELEMVIEWFFMGVLIRVHRWIEGRILMGLLIFIIGWCTEKSV